MSDHRNIPPGDRRFQLATHHRKQHFGGKSSRFKGLMWLRSVNDQRIAAVHHLLREVRVMVQRDDDGNLVTELRADSLKQITLRIGSILGLSRAMQIEIERVDPFGRTQPTEQLVLEKLQRVGGDDTARTSPPANQRHRRPVDLLLGGNFQKAADRTDASRLGEDFLAFVQTVLLEGFNRRQRRAEATRFLAELGNCDSNGTTLVGLATTATSLIMAPLVIAINTLQLSLLRLIENRPVASTTP